MLKYLFARAQFYAGLSMVSRMERLELPDQVGLGFAQRDDGLSGWAPKEALVRILGDSLGGRALRRSIGIGAAG